MISFSQYLKEVHLVDLTIPPGRGGVRTSIYKNPSSSDLTAMYKEGLTNGMVRYAAVNANKTIFVWDANKALHSDLLKTLENWAVVFKNDSVKR